MMRKTIMCFLLAALICGTSCAAPGTDYLPGESAATEYILPDVDPKDAPSNSVPLENHNYYNSVEDIDLSVDSLYITVFPTYNEEGELLTRKVFDNHKALIRDYNPTLNAHIWQGNPEDTVNRDKRFGFDGLVSNCTIRVRGNSSRGLPIKNFKVKLTEPGASLYGYDSINLNKHLMDDTRTNNKMATDLLQLMRYNMSSIKTRFLRLYINDVGVDGSETGFQDQGLYIWLEQPSKDYLINHGLDPNGALYKAELFEFRRYPDELRTEDDPLYDEKVFNEIIEPVCNPDHAKLIEMLEAINDYSRSFEETFHKYFDEDNYLAWLTTNILFGNTDALVHNFMLYSPPNSDKWYFLPWDYDESFDYKEIDEWNQGYYQVFGVHVFWAIPFHQRYLRLESSVEKISSGLNEMRRTIFTESNFTYLNERYLKILREFYSRDPDLDWVIDYHIDRYLRTLDLSEEEFESFDDRSFWFRVRSAEDPFTAFFERRVEEPVNNRYAAIRNNHDRYRLTLESPTAGYIQEPVKTDKGWIFRWDAAFDFQRDRVYYELIVASDMDLTNILYHVKDLQANEYLIKSLPAGDVFCRVITRDEHGHEQYPLNIVITRINGVSSRRYSLAHFTIDDTQ